MSSKAAKVIQKYSLVHNVFIARQHHTWILVSLAAILQFRTFSANVTQANWHSKGRLPQEIYSEPRKDFELNDERSLKFWKISMNYQQALISNNARLENSFKRRCTRKPASSLQHRCKKTNQQRLIGICAACVDETLHAKNVGHASLV